MWTQLLVLGLFTLAKGDDHQQKTMPPTESDFFLKVPELSQPNVFIKNKTDVSNILKKIVADGIDKLQFIADYDSTLTKSLVDGKLTSHTIDIFSKTETLSKKYRDGCLALSQKYGPQVESPKLSEAEIQNLLDQWWQDHERLTVGESITVEDIHRSTDLVNTPLRDGCEEVLSFLQRRRIPLTVVSAGFGEVIDYTLRKFRPVVVSNYMKLENKRLLGFSKPTISVYNKHQIPLPVQEGRNNIILLGDSLGDCSMADNVSNKETALKIGFLTGGDDNKLEKYCNSYDVVVRDDQTMHLVSALLRLVCNDINTEPDTTSSQNKPT